MPVGFVCPQCDALTDLGVSRCPACGAALGWNGVAVAGGGAKAQPPPAELRATGNPPKHASAPARMEAAMSTKPCPGCGNQVPADDRFCGKCGTRLAGAEPPATGPSKTMYFS